MPGDKGQQRLQGRPGTFPELQFYPMFAIAADGCRDTVGVATGGIADAEDNLHLAVVIERDTASIHTNAIFTNQGASGSDEAERAVIEHQANRRFGHIVVVLQHRSLSG